MSPRRAGGCRQTPSCHGEGGVWLACPGRGLVAAGWMGRGSAGSWVWDAAPELPTRQPPCDMRPDPGSVSGSTCRAAPGSLPGCRHPPRTLGSFPARLRVVGGGSRRRSLSLALPRLVLPARGTAGPGVSSDLAPVTVGSVASFLCILQSRSPEWGGAGASGEPGPLLGAWLSLRSVPPRDGPPAPPRDGSPLLPRGMVPASCPREAVIA